jgi:hypothetical protein
MKKKTGGVQREKKSITTLKGSPEWGEWLSGFAEDRRVSVMALIDHALAHYAKAEGFQPPPKR